MPCPKVNCHYRNNDDICQNIYGACRIYIRYKHEQDILKEKSERPDKESNLQKKIKEEEKGKK